MRSSSPTPSRDRDAEETSAHLRYAVVFSTMSPPYTVSYVDTVMAAAAAPLAVSSSSAMMAFRIISTTVGCRSAAPIKKKKMAEVVNIMKGEEVKLRDEQRRNAEATFKKYDADDSGTLEPNEIRDARDGPGGRRSLPVGP